MSVDQHEIEREMHNACTAYRRLSPRTTRWLRDQLARLDEIDWTQLWVAALSDCPWLIEAKPEEPAMKVFYRLLAWKQYDDARRWAMLVQAVVDSEKWQRDWLATR